MLQGLSSKITGPTLNDLKDRLGVDIEAISRAMVWHHVGWTFGALLCGAIYERLPKYSDLLLTLACLLCGLSVILLPLVNSLFRVATIFFIWGIGNGFSALGMQAGITLCFSCTCTHQ